jgi:polysaccharide deacetylase family protein (PEP-CTERM system associated)
MTVDVEDYFQVQAFADVIPRSAWDAFEQRIEASTDRILDLFARVGINATFFTLGWVAERYPALVRRIVNAGHELASHGYDHRPAYEFDAAAFRRDVGRTRRLLEDLGGVPVAGYRAPTFSIGCRTPWAYAALAAEGYLYSSSIYPVRHDLYGAPDAPRGPFRPQNGMLWEFPMSTVRRLGRNWPCSGGGYFRLLPYTLFRHGLAALNRGEAAPGIFYTHPWEIDAEQPRLPAGRRSARLRHYLNLSRTFPRLQQLLRDFAWDRMDRVFAHYLGSVATPSAASPAVPEPALRLAS